MTRDVMDAPAADSSAACGSRFRRACRLTANAAGAFVASVTLPASMTTGVYTVNGIGDGGNVGYGVVVVTSPNGVAGDTCPPVMP